MPRRTFTNKLSLPHRLKQQTSYSSNPNSTPTSVPASRTGSPKLRAMPEQPAPGLVLRATVIKGRDLAAKDRSGTSDPYLVLSLGDEKFTTPTINKQLNPEWNETLELPIIGEQSLLLEVVCWDKDRFGKDYMGEFDVILEEQFQNGLTQQEPQWFPLQARRAGKKKSVVSGEIQIQISLIDPVNLAATPEQILQKFFAIAGQTPSPDEDDGDLMRGDSNLTDAEDDESSSDEAQDESKKAEKREKRRKKLKLARLKRKVKAKTGYEYSSTGDIAGVLFLEIQKCTDLPPQRNVTRTTFDMDPFVVTSLGKKTYRTKTVSHNLNPVFDEKLVFQVLRHETNYSVNFTVIDKDKFSGNDYVGTVNFPLEKAISTAPQEDPETGLYRLPDPSDSPGISPSDSGSSKKSRFRIPMSRSASTHSLSRLGRPSLKKESSTGSLSVQDSNGSSAPTAGPHNAAADSNGNLAVAGDVNINPSAVDDEDLKMYTLPLELKEKERWGNKHNPTLYIRAKYLPYKALRQQFWRAMLKQYDADESGLLDKVELTTMLDTLGSTLHESTIDSFFDRFADAHNGDSVLTFDEAVICLEDQLQATETRDSQRSGVASGTQTPSLASGMLTPINQNSSTTSIPVLETNTLGREGEEGDTIQIDDLADEKGEEHVIEIRECPICHQPKLNKRSDANIITHIATCASQDWRQVNNIVMAGFVTSSQAQRKWYSKVITKISYGGYKLGANSANILVQDRLTGQINEERMSVYVRLGIRLLYKGLKSNSMEKKRIRKLLKSLSFKQGRKYDDPASASEIIPFINFHQLDMSEVLLPTDQFKNFNEFFYRALKPGARPCSAPDDPRVIVSPSDCRTVVFNTIDSAQAIWVKGRDFTVERLLGDAYPEDAKRYHGGSLGIFRLAPQDYHRFHIPVDGVMDEPKTIEGEYYTVNPMAIRSALDVYGENVRVVVPIDSVAHGRVMVICVGAMMVGSTVITRKKGDHVKRAEELGYFKFGGSTLLLLFEPGQMRYDEDLVDNSNSALETLVRVGMSIGHSPNRPAYVPDMRKANPTNEEKQDAKRRIEGSLAPAGVKGPMPGAGM